MSKCVPVKALRCILPFLLVVMLIAGLFPAFALAADSKDVPTETFTITGDFSGTFKLESNKTSLFNLVGMVPGDSWEGKIDIVNDTPGDMLLTIISIESTLDDTALYNALTLEISTGNKVLYSGSYGATPTPVSKTYSLEAGETMTFAVEVALPETVGNDLQGKEMKSVWTFEAQCDYTAPSPGPTPDVPPQTGVDVFLSTMRDSSFLWIILLALAGAVIVSVKVHNTKKAMNINERSVDGDDEDENKEE